MPDNTEFLRATVKRCIDWIEASGPAGHRADGIAVPVDDLLILLMAANEAIVARESVPVPADQVRAEAMEEAAGIAYKRTGGYETGIDLSARAAEYRKG